MKRHLTLFLLLFATLIYSCNKENIQPYKDIDQINIVSPQDTTITLAQLQQLRISPMLSGINAKKEYAYEWRIYEDKSYRILSDKQQLDMLVELPVGKYTIQFQVMDKITAIKAIGQLYSLNVTGAFPEGWLIGNNSNGKGQMSFIRTSDGKVFLNPLEDINHASYPEKLVASISGVKPTPFYGSFKQLFYFTENGLRVFDAETMLQTSELNEYFYKPMTFEQQPAYGTNALNIDQFLINKGDVYAADGLNFGDNSSFGTFSDRFEGDYSMFPFVFNDASLTTYFYDNKNKRFMSCTYQGRELTIASRATTNGQYNLNSIGKTMLGSDATLSGNYLSLMRDETKSYIYAFRLRAASAIAAGYYSELSGAQQIDQITGFAAASDIERAYYSSKNNVYKVSAANGSVAQIYSFPKGSEIVDLKMLKAGTDANRQLVIAINNGQVGEIHCIYINEFGDLDTSKPPIVYSGFGVITNISYRVAS